jgi:hypothetical protein
MIGLLSGATMTARRMRADRRAALVSRLLAKHDPVTSPHDWVAVLDAGNAIGRFDSRSWLHEVDVPTSVVVTARDHVVPPRRQLDLASVIDGATVHPVDGDHAVCVAHAEAFVPPLLAAVDSVADRVRVATPVAA